MLLRVVGLTFPALRGIGLYETQASFRSSDGSICKHNLFRARWNAPAGVHLERTAGLVVNLETAVNAVDVPGRWTPFFDVGIGVGAKLVRP